jgi:hypothetical protein
MNPHTPHGATPHDHAPFDSSANTATPPPGLSALAGRLSQLAGEAREVFQDRIHLLGLEMQRASAAVGTMAVLMVVAALTGITAWLALWAGAIVALINHAELTLLWALVVVAVLHAVAALVALLWARSLVAKLSFPATRRHLSLAPAPVRPRATMRSDMPAASEMPAP